MEAVLKAVTGQSTPTIPPPQDYKGEVDIIRASKTRVKTCKLPEARENESDGGAIGLSPACDWLRRWREISGPITIRGEVRPKQ